MIEEERAENAVWFLVGGAKKYGALRGHQAYCEANLRRVKSLLMLRAPDSSAAMKEAWAYAQPEYLAAMEDHQNATAAAETERALREGGQYCIEMWRSQNSARKQGVTA